MLDPKILRENPEKIRKMLNDRGIDFDLDSLIRLDKDRREFIAKTDELRKKKKPNFFRYWSEEKIRSRCNIITG